jgi:hypothetical protein
MGFRKQFGLILLAAFLLSVELNVKQLPAQRISLLGDTLLPFPWESSALQVCSGTTRDRPFAVPPLGLNTVLVHGAFLHKLQITDDEYLTI